MGCMSVVGNPYGETTHTDSRSRLGIPINSSIMNAVGTCGLQLHTFGQAVSLVFTDTWTPDTLYDRIKEDVDPGLHTLVLLDIRESSSWMEDLQTTSIHVKELITIWGCWC
ncbi:hypothetical protein EDD85DRAFT_229964 [Armillaria nabsnona]|nr:hypothetical protein EDD85DRAFT_229964 [Armillaria nabsnona]